MTRLEQYLASLSFALCLLVASVCFAGEPNKQEDDVKFTRSTQAQTYYDQIQSVLAQPAFGEKKKVKRWRVKEQKEDDDEEQNAFLKWLENLLRSSSKHDGSDRNVNIAFGIEILLWALLVALIAYLIIKYRTELKSLISGMKSAANEAALPTTMFGLDVKKASMPDDVVGEAKALWQAGENRQAVAMLLRASLVKLMHEHQCLFLDSDTEAECCVRIEKHVPQQLSQYMHLLVQVWQQIAYGHRAPTQDVFNSLCRQWQEVF